MQWKRSCSTAGSPPPGPGYNVDYVLEPLVEAPPAGRPPLTGRQRTLAAAILLIMVAGLTVHFLTVGFAADFVADALYAVVVFLVLSFVFAHRPGWQAAVGAIVFCAGIEALQLTGLPAVLGEVFPPALLVLGSTFSALDLVAYVIGVLVALGVATWPRQD